MLRTLDNLDKSISKRVHNVDSAFVTAVLFPFAKLFNPQFIVLPGLFLLYVAETLRVFASRHESIAFVLFYFSVVIPANVTVTLTTKRLFGRPRPHAEGLKFKRKPLNLRSREKNCSFPSGDAMEAAAFLATLYHLLHASPDTEQYFAAYFAYVAALQVLVNTGRVYFLCHYFGDTLFGAALGVLVTRGVFLFVYGAFSEAVHPLIVTLFAGAAPLK